MSGPSDTQPAGVTWTVAFVSAAALGFEISLMRLLLVAGWHHFAFLVISMVLLGLGASGTALCLARTWVMPRAGRVLWVLALATASSMPLCTALVQHVPVEARIELFKHLRSLLKPNGRILLTTGCMNGGIEFELVNLIHAATEGWGRLPDKDEMLQQLSAAGFERNSAINLLPGDKYYAFTGYRPV